MHKSQILFYLLLVFIGGVFVASFLPVSQTWILILLILAIGLIAISGYQKTYSRRGLFAGLLFLVFVFGVIRFNSFNFTNSILKQFADTEILGVGPQRGEGPNEVGTPQNAGNSVGGKGIEVVLNGYIDDEPDVSGNKMNFVFRAKELVVPDKTIDTDEKILVTVNSFPVLNYGDKLSISGMIKTPQNFTDFDYAAYLKKQNIRTVMFFPKISEESYFYLGFFERTKTGLYKKIFGLKDKFESAINKSISEPNASFINGILLGSRQNISEEIKESFNKTGTTHILAISGYNIMIISWAVLVGLVYFFKRRTAFWISIGIIILFTILTGASASVVRATLMGLLLLFANGYGRLYDAKNSIILAGAIMIFINPFALVFDIGFQLSFLAVMGLLFLYPYLNRKITKIPELGGIKDLALMTISAQVFVLPLLIYYFHQFSLWSLPANIMILPFVPFAMLTGFLSGISGMIFLPFGKIIGMVAWAITTYQIWVVNFFS